MGMRDPFRREPRNVGVVVLKAGVVAGKFAGETAPGQIDGRSIRWLAHPDIYRQWVESWREEINAGPFETAVKRLMNSNAGNYQVVTGGQVTDTGTDSAETICNHLYRLLVTETALSEGPASADESESSATILRADIASEFRKRDILGIRHSGKLPHPILSDVPVLGKKLFHTPAYVQKNKVLYVMEPINFQLQRKGTAKDHAGWAAKMFDDIYAHNPLTKPIAIVRAGAEELRDDTVKYAMGLIESSARVVQWLNPGERQQFLAERETVARTLTPGEEPEAPQ
jgi:hypothetical protein